MHVYEIHKCQIYTQMISNIDDLQITNHLYINTIDKLFMHKYKWYMLNIQIQTTKPDTIET